MKHNDFEFTDKYDAYSAKIMDLIINKWFKRQSANDFPSCQALLQTIYTELPFVPPDQAFRYFEIELRILEEISAYM